MKKNQRFLRNFLINPRFQIRIGIWLLTSGFLLATSYSIIFYAYIRENYKILVELSPMTEESKILLIEELHQIIGLMSIASVAFLIIMAILSIVMTHRSAGPIYHFQRVFREIQSGKTKTRVTLRPKDDFQEVAKSFNDMMDSLDTNHSSSH